MKLKKLNSSREISFNISRYLIDWDRVVSKPQKAVKDFLYPYWKKHPAVCEEFRIPGSLLRIDLVNFYKKLAIEVSPTETHRRYNPYFHQGSRWKFVSNIKRDLDKQNWCEQNGLAFIEIYTEDIEGLSVDWFSRRFDIYIC